MDVALRAALGAIGNDPLRGRLLEPAGHAEPS